MAEFHITISDEAEAIIKTIRPQVGDILWIKLAGDPSQDTLRKMAGIAEEVLERLGLQGQVPMVISKDPHELHTLDADAMERLGWVRKKGTR